MVSMPPKTKAENTHELMSSGRNPPWRPTARMITTGPEIANSQATRALTRLWRLTPARLSPRPGKGRGGNSKVAMAGRLKPI